MRATERCQWPRKCRFACGLPNFASLNHINIMWLEKQPGLVSLGLGATGQTLENLKTREIRAIEGKSTYDSQYLVTTLALPGLVLIKLSCLEVDALMSIIPDSDSEARARLQNVVVIPVVAVLWCTSVYTLVHWEFVLFAFWRGL